MANETKPNPLNDDKYRGKAIRFSDKGDHYELVFTDAFDVPTDGSLGTPYTVITDIVLDMKEANKNKELHIFVGSYGGAAHCLNMILQHVNQFKHVVGINLGYACSCGFMLLAHCDEIYTTPYASFLYHSMSTLEWGKISEIKHSNEFHHKWWNILVNNSKVRQMLTDDELKLGETSEVWLTGQDLIDRGVAAEYEMYSKRNILQPDTDSFYIVGNDVYRKEGSVFKRYVKDSSTKKNTLTYFDLVVKNYNENILKK